MTFPHLVTVSPPTFTNTVTYAPRSRFPNTGAKPGGGFTHCYRNGLGSAELSWSTHVYGETKRAAERNGAGRSGVTERSSPTQAPPEAARGRLLCPRSTLGGQLLVSGRTGRCNKRKEHTGRAKPPFPNMVHSCQGPESASPPITFSPLLAAARVPSLPLPLLAITTPTW